MVLIILFIVNDPLQVDRNGLLLFYSYEILDLQEFKVNDKAVY